MSIQLPKPDKPNHGLVQVRKRWFLVFREDGVQRRIALNTTDETEARRHRDAAYAKLIENGAEVGRKTGRPKILPPGFTGTLPEGVSYRLPWQATVGKTKLGNFATMDGAAARVREYLLGRNVKRLASADVNLNNHAK
jgi:hypothetical protein